MGCDRGSRGCRRHVPAALERDGIRLAIALQVLIEHDLFGKPVPTPDHVEGKLFGIMLWLTGAELGGAHSSRAALSRGRARRPLEDAMPQSVLVVDDEANILLSLEFLMKKAGYEVRLARDGEEALAEIGKARPDLVLLDVMMPKRNGFDVCEAIRANPEWRAVRVILLTAKGRDIEREKGLALGADDYITKPFSTREVVERVTAWIGPAK